MNEGMKTGPQGLRLLMHFEKGPTDGSVPLSENGAALAPYVCPGDELTIGYGCTHWFDGSEVAIHHRLKDEAEAVALLKHNLPEYERAVIKGAERPMTQNQFDAFVSRCFNIGTGAFSTSSALRSFNEGRFEDAASDFGMWTGSTTARPPKKYRENPDYADKLIKDHKGLWRWKGPDGQYCRYMLRLSGLLDRCYSEALVFMNRDFMRTIRSPERMELELIPTPASEAKWNAIKGRWEDGTKFRTPFKAVLARAWSDPLPDTPGGALVAVAPIPDSAIAIPDTPAAPPQATAKAGTPEPSAPSPQAPASPAQNPAASTSSGPSRDVADKGVAPSAPVAPSPTIHPGNAPVPKVTFPKDEPKVAPAPPAVVVAGQDGTKPKSPNTTLPADVPYKIDVNAGLKPIDESDRVKGYVIQQIGIGAIRLGSLGVFGTTIQAGAQTVQGDPVLSNIVLMGVVAGGIAITGYVVKVYGTWKRRRGEEKAAQALF